MNLEPGKPLTIDQLDYLRRERLALSKITEQQKRFCEVYASTMDKILALREAGYSLPKHKGGAQSKLIEKTFNRVMKSEAVKEYLTLLQQSVASRLGVSMDMILEEYRRIAFANISDYISWDATGIVFTKDSDALTQAQKAGILEVTETQTKHGRVVRVKLHNKQAALDKLYQVLCDLEKVETAKPETTKLSLMQIYLLLSDPVKRRAIEHIADVVSDNKVSLTFKDKNKAEFYQHMERIAKELLQRGVGNTDPAPIELTHGATGTESPACGNGSRPDEPVGEQDADPAGDGRDQSVEIGDPWTAGKEEVGQYDIDGL